MKTTTASTRSRRKSCVRDGGPSIFTQRSSGGSLRTSITLLVVSLLLLLMLPGCSSVKAATINGPVYPVKQQVIMLTVKQFATPEETTAACKALGAPGKAPMACAVVKKGQSVLYLTKPTSWCDFETLKVWGHELAHATGLSHSVAYRFSGTSGYSGKHCGFVEDE